jgi:hypothetical protein
MKVYLLLEAWGNDAPSVSLVFATQEAADEWIKVFYQQADDYTQSRCTLSVQEYEVIQ